MQTPERKSNLAGLSRDWHYNSWPVKPVLESCAIWLTQSAAVSILFHGVQAYRHADKILRNENVRQRTRNDWSYSDYYFLLTTCFWRVVAEVDLTGGTWTSTLAILSGSSTGADGACEVDGAAGGSDWACLAASNWVFFWIRASMLEICCQLVFTFSLRSSSSLFSLYSLDVTVI